MIDAATIRPEFQAQYARLRVQWLRWEDDTADRTTDALDSQLPGDWDAVTAARAIASAAWWAMHDFEATPENFIDCPYRSGLEQADIGLKIHDDKEMYS